MSRQHDEPARPRFTTADYGAAAFTALYMVIAVASAFFLQNKEFLFYIVVMCVLIAAVTALHLKVGFRSAVLWGLSIWGLAHMAGGLLPLPESWPVGGETHVLYNLWLIPGLLKFDQLVHAYGFGLVTWICWLSLQRAFVRRGVEVRPTFGLLVLCAAGGMGFGAANEIVEFIAVLTVPNTNVGGYENTGWDLVANLVGCVIAAASIAWSARTGSAE